MLLTRPMRREEMEEKILPKTAGLGLRYGRHLDVPFRMGRHDTIMYSGLSELGNVNPNEQKIEDEKRSGYRLLHTRNVTRVTFFANACQLPAKTRDIGCMASGKPGLTSSMHTDRSVRM